MILIDKADMSPARLAEIEQKYVNRTEYGDMKEIGDLLANIYRLQAVIASIVAAATMTIPGGSIPSPSPSPSPSPEWHNVRDWTIVDTRLPVVVRHISPDGVLLNEWKGAIIHWMDPPQIGTPDGETRTLEFGEYLWRPM